MELPSDLNNADVNSQLSNFMQNLSQQIQSGAIAPSNSLLQQSLDTLSLQANALKQSQGATGPSADDLMARLTQLMPGAGGAAPAAGAVDVSQLLRAMQGCRDAQRVTAAFQIASARVRAAREAEVTAALQGAVDAYFAQMRQNEPRFCVNLFEQLGELTEFDEKYLLELSTIRSEVKQPDN